VIPQLFGLFFGSLLSATVSAAGGAINPVLDDSFTFKLGADFLKADGTFSSTIAGNRTVKISTSDLGVDASNATPYFGFRWRFADRWRLTFDYIGGNTDGGVRKDFGDLNFGDISTSGFLAVDTDFYIAQAGYSFLKNEHAELGIGGGFHIVRFETKLKVSGGIDGFIGGSVQSDSVDLTAPLPNILGFGTYAITPKLSLDGNVGWFALDYNDYSGNLVALNANLEYRVTKHFGVGRWLQLC
jgi:hypothetical protein